MMHYYTGVGSREIDPDTELVMQKVSAECKRRGYILRSGRAPGSDAAFEYPAGSQAELYIPWPRFAEDVPLNGCPQVIVPGGKLFLQAQEMAAEIHPAWDKCSRPAQLLHTRNIFQVLGKDLNTPSDFLVCYALPDKRSVKGGTRTAYELAKRLDIPTYNLYFPNEEDALMEFLELEYAA